MTTVIPFITEFNRSTSPILIFGKTQFLKGLSNAQVEGVDPDKQALIDKGA